MTTAAAAAHMRTRQMEVCGLSPVRHSAEKGGFSPFFLFVLMGGRWWVVGGTDGAHILQRRGRGASAHTHNIRIWPRGRGKTRREGGKPLPAIPPSSPSIVAPRRQKRSIMLLLLLLFAASIQQTYETRLHGAILYTYEKPKASDCRLPSSYWPRMNVRGNLFPFFSIPPISPSFCPCVVPLRKRREGEEKAICLQSLLSPSFSPVPLSFSLGRDIHLLSSLPPSDSQGGRGGVETLERARPRALSV